MDKLKINQETLVLSGNVDKTTVPRLYHDYFKDYTKKKIKSIDLKEVELLDSAGVALLDEIRSKAKQEGRDIILLNCSEDAQSALRIFGSLDLAESARPKKPGLFEGVGHSVTSLVKELYEMLVLTSDIVYWSIVGLVDKKGQRKGSLIQQGVLIGVDALPIVALLSFIIGLIISLQSATQLKQFGANMFLANLISISMVRELGPLITAIIVAGRSGSAIASEIATMKVSEEIDALKMMALNPIRFVVVPKFHAVTFCMPLLVLFSILIGILGGLIIAVGYLDLSVISFLNTCLEMTELKDIMITMFKSIVFAWQIVIVGSHYGFQVVGGAEGVGKATTVSVVISIFSVIIMDAVFSLFYLI